MTKLVLALFLCSVEVLYKDNVAAIVAEALSFIKILWLLLLSRRCCSRSAKLRCASIIYKVQIQPPMILHILFLYERKVHAVHDQSDLASHKLSRLRFPPVHNE